MKKLFFLGALTAGVCLFGQNGGSEVEKKFFSSLRQTVSSDAANIIDALQLNETVDDGEENQSSYQEIETAIVGILEDMVETGEATQVTTIVDSSSGKEISIVTATHESIGAPASGEGFTGPSVSASADSSNATVVTDEDLPLTILPPSDGEGFTGPAPSEHSDVPSFIEEVSAQEEDSSLTTTSSVKTTRIAKTKSHASIIATTVKTAVVVGGEEEDEILSISCTVVGDDDENNSTQPSSVHEE